MEGMQTKKNDEYGASENGEGRGKTGANTHTRKKSGASRPRGETEKCQKSTTGGCEGGKRPTKRLENGKKQKRGGRSKKKIKKKRISSARGKVGGRTGIWEQRNTVAKVLEQLGRKQKRTS